MRKLLCLVLSLAMVIGCLAVPALADGLTDGTYEGSAMGKNGELTVSVTVENGAVSAVEVTSHSDDLSVCQPALDKLPGQIVEAQSLGLDTVTGCTITSQAILDAAAVAIELAGGNMEDWTKAVEKEANTAVEEYDADVVVVGAGASGSAAALSAAQNGAKVVVIEKAATAGGSGAMSMGMGAQGSSQQVEAGATFTASQWLNDWLKQQNYMVSAPMIYKYITNSGATVDWLLENGADITFVGHEQGALVGNEIATYHEWGEGGFGAIAANLVNKVAEAGGVVLFETTGKEVLMENGAVSGLKAEKADGTTVVVNAKAVILATGGYGADQDRMVELLGQKVNGINSGTQTGDGIAMGQAVGAALDGATNVEYHGVAIPDECKPAGVGSMAGDLVGLLVQEPSAIWVNVDGYRFTNEDICYDTAYLGNTAATQGDHYFVILNQSMVDTWENEGQAAVGRVTANTGFSPKAVDEPWTGLSDNIEEYIVSGGVIKADTLEELAEKCGINAKNLVATMADYNATCEKGVDDYMSKDPEFLTAMNEGPYYAVVGRASELCTLGGLKITTDFEVVDTENAVIPGLYSAGVDCSGSMYNNSYVSYEGVTMGWCTTSGRLAGINAAAYAAE